MTANTDTPTNTATDVAERLRLRRHLVEEFSNLAEKGHAEEINFFLALLLEGAVSTAQDLSATLGDLRSGADSVVDTATTKPWSIWLIYSRRDIEAQAGFENMFEALASVIPRLRLRDSPDAIEGFHLFATSQEGPEVRFAYHI